MGWLRPAPWLLALLLVAVLTFGTALAGAGALAAEKLFDFGNLNVDLSKVRAKTEQQGAAPQPGEAPAAKADAPARRSTGATLSTPRP